MLNLKICEKCYVEHFVDGTEDDAKMAFARDVKNNYCVCFRACEKAYREKNPPLSTWSNWGTSGYITPLIQPTSTWYTTTFSGPAITGGAVYSGITLTGGITSATLYKVGVDLSWDIRQQLCGECEAIARPPFSAPDAIPKYCPYYLEQTMAISEGKS